ncbi:MAG: threonine synthase [Thermoanaerobaculia bacterium]
MQLICSECRSEFPDGPMWCCGECHGALELRDVAFRPDAIVRDDHSMWRYRAMLPVGRDVRIVTMGEGMTPLVEREFAGREVHFKLEYVSPTGSFKDRGTSLLVTKLREWGVTAAADDSSGNAGASLAGYCAHAGIAARIFVPAHTSPQKKAQIEVFGATLHCIDGSRERATGAVEAAVATSALAYASHAWSPFTYHATKTVAYEVWEQLGRRAPDCFVSPIGQGSLFLGVWRGFKDLLAAGLIAKMPRMIGVQSDACAPIVEAFRRGLDRGATITKRTSIAEGIALANPIHDREILAAIRQTGGEAIAVSDEETRLAQTELARAGCYVESTSAVVGAALRKSTAAGVIVAALTGTGLKNETPAFRPAQLIEKTGAVERI